MKKTEFLPLGSIVIVAGGVKKMMIISRGLAMQLEQEQKYFDYGACLYPEGLVGDQVMYFNHTDIAKMVFEGFADDDNTLMVENINQQLAKTTLKRGNASEEKQKANQTK